MFYDKIKDTMKIKNKTLEFQTEKIFYFIDFTSEAEKFLDSCDIENGFLNVQIMHTSAGLVLNENEPFLLEDIRDHLEKSAPRSRDYKHNNLEERTVNVCENECENGHSHCNAIQLPATVTLNVVGGKLQLGQWQRIMLVELDRARHRKVQLQIIGE